MASADHQNAAIYHRYRPDADFGNQDENLTSGRFEGLELG